MAKRARKQGAFALALALAALVGCSLVVDSSDIDEGCGESAKLCQGRCVSSSDPAFGCEPGICSPCPFSNAIPECRGTVCAIKECVFGFGCDKCKTSLLTDEKHCGDCDTACTEGQSCADGHCITPR